MTNPDITIDFIDRDGAVLDAAGYNVADFFCDRGAWMDAEYDTPSRAFYAAEEMYRGPDLDGVGVRVTFWHEAAQNYLHWPPLPHAPAR